MFEQTSKGRIVKLRLPENISLLASMSVTTLHSGDISLDSK